MGGDCRRAGAGRAGFQHRRCRRAAKFDRTTLMRLEAGTHAVSVRVLHNVAHALGVPIGPLAEALCSDRQQDTHLP